MYDKEAIVTKPAKDVFLPTEICSIFEMLGCELQHNTDLLHGILLYCRVLCKYQILWQGKLVLFFPFCQWWKLMCRGVKKYVQRSQEIWSWPGAAAETAAIGAKLLRESLVACLLVLICSGWLEEHCWPSIGLLEVFFWL